VATGVASVNADGRVAPFGKPLDAGNVHLFSATTRGQFSASGNQQALEHGHGYTSQRKYVPPCCNAQEIDDGRVSARASCRNPMMVQPKGCRVPEMARSAIAPAIWVPDGKLRGWIGIALLAMVLGTGYVMISRVTALPPEIPLPLPRPPEAPQPPVSVPLGTPQLISRGDKFLFACDIPAPAEKTASQFPQKLQEYKNSMEIFGDAVGVTYTFFYIRGGIRMEMEVATDEMKRRVLMAVGIPGVTKLTLEIRRATPQQVIVSVYANLPEVLRQFCSLVTPDPSSPATIDGRKQIERILGVADGTCHII